MWLLACREGFERDIVEELLISAPALAPRVLVPGIVVARSALPLVGGHYAITFARQGFPIAAVLGGSTRQISDAAAEALGAALPIDGPVCVQTWVPDSDEGNLLSQEAAALRESLIRRLVARDPALAERLHEGDPRLAGGVLAQVALVTADLAFAGVVPVAEALSTAPGGRSRTHVGAAAPSRAAMKLEEALGWLGVGPEPGDLCVDLGAAPGGWTWVLLERRARVVAVDPGRLAPNIADRKGVAHVPGNAFAFAPDEPVDWLLCDMVWKPLEVATLLARWGRNRWARTLVSNVKLPMKHKAEFVARVRSIVESGGWRDIRTRHLYHDRDEITLTAWLR